MSGAMSQLGSVVVSQLVVVGWKNGGGGGGGVGGGVGGGER